METMLAKLVRSLRRRNTGPERAPAVFIQGDATGSVIENVETDADIFIGGDRTDSVIRNVVHRPRRQRG